MKTLIRVDESASLTRHWMTRMYDIVVKLAWRNFDESDRIIERVIIREIKRL